MTEYVAEKQHKVCFSYQQTRICGIWHIIFRSEKTDVDNGGMRHSSCS